MSRRTTSGATPPSAYPDLPGLEEVYLEGAPVERVVVGDDRLVLVVRAALLGDHPDYEPPPPGEVHCRARLLLDWRGATSVAWHDAAPDDLGCLEAFDVDGDRMTLRGGFGHIEVRGRPPRVGAPRT